MIVAPLLLLIFARTSRVTWPRRRVGDCSRALRKQLGSTLVIVTGIVSIILTLLSVAAPLLQLSMTERTWSEFGPAVTAGTNALFNSLEYSVLAALVSVALGLLLWRIRVISAMWLVFLVPGVLLGIALTTGLNRPSLAWFYRSSLVIVTALTLRYLALAWSSARQAMRAIDQNIVEALRLEGARGLTLFRHAIWPQVAPQLTLAAYVLYLLCLWDVETIVTIVPPGGETLALRIFNLLHYGHNTHVNTLCVLLLLLALAPLLVWIIARLFSTRRLVTASATAMLALLFVACSPTEEQHSTAIRSKLFGSVEIIGERGTAAGQFNKPRSVAVDTNDNLFVIDMTGRVQKFSPQGKFLFSWEMPQTELGKPKGLCRDRNGNIVVLEPHYQRVNVFTPDGKLVVQWGRRGTNAGEFMLPRDVAVNSKGEVLVPEYMDSERVQKFSARGELLQIIGKGGLNDGEFNRAEGIDVDASDRIYVADSCNHRIQIFSPDGKFVRAYGKSGRAPGEFSYPYDICVDADGRQYVCEFGNGRISVFDANDHLIEVIGKPGGAPGEFANPWGMALDSKGNLYVADSQNHRVQKLIRRTERRMSHVEIRHWTFDARSSTTTT
jgi:DNA-binding beta-propeller fold protein YncE/ABC-type spermidine/putrescine transport system permease subunit II